VASEGHGTACAAGVGVTYMPTARSNEHSGLCRRQQQVRSTGPPLAIPRVPTDARGEATHRTNAPCNVHIVCVCARAHAYSAHECVRAWSGYVVRGRNGHRYVLRTMPMQTTGEETGGRYDVSHLASTMKRSPKKRIDWSHVDACG
jgi:hypothetical protein